MIANVMDMNTEQQEKTSATVAVGRNSLMSCIESAIPQESQYVFEYPRVDQAGGLGPLFSKLPRELRDQIFSDLIVSGNPQFMSVSRVLKTEGKALVYKKGIYRLNFGYDIDRWQLGFLKDNCLRPFQKIADNIRNLSITVKVQDFSLPTLASRHLHSEAFQYVNILMGFRLTYMHGPCYIGGCCNKVARMLWNIILVIRGLTAFDTVELYIDTDLNHRNCSKLWQIERITYFRSVVCEDLEPFLRQEIVESDVDKLHLIFHPRKAWKETGREGDRELRNTGAHAYMKTQMGRDCGHF